MKSLNVNRERKVTSTLQNITYGDPQGSILGPLLFLWYILILPEMAITSSLCTYAGESNMLVKDVSKKSMWVSYYNYEAIIGEMKFTFKIKEIKLCFFFNCSTKRGRVNRYFNVLVENVVSNQQDHTTFIDLTGDANLSCDKHVVFVRSKISSGIFALWRRSKLCYLDTLKSIYLPLIHSHFAYGISICGATSKANL